MQSLFSNPDDKQPEVESGATPIVDPEARRSKWRHAPKGSKRHPILARTGFGLLVVLSSLFGVMAGLTLIYGTNLPQMDELTRYRPETMTELLDRQGRPIGSIALERRVVVGYDDIPPVLRNAIISIEDKSFERNWGVNVLRMGGAAAHDLMAHEREQGGSTLTMQLARNLFLSSERSFGRKLQEIFLTIQIERRFTKQQIFTLYCNQIYLGHGIYGFEAGSEYYFSKHARDLTLPEAALLAALPKGPEAYSPLRSPERALRRRNLVIAEMLHDGRINQRQADDAMTAPLGLHVAAPPNSVAPWFVEEVRRQLEQQFGMEMVSEDGLRVTTTLDLDLQRVATKALLDGLATYERRHGWKGHLENVVLAGQAIDAYRHPDWTASAEPGSYVHALVLEAAPQRVRLRVGARQEVVMTPDDWRWTALKDGDELFKTGDIAYVKLADAPAADGLHAQLEQDSGAQGSLMAVDNATGEILAMVGGRDFALSQFNRATQAQRQVGSSFKPYVYTAAVEDGAKPTDTIVDAPVSFPTASGPYTPHNYEGDYKGTMTLLSAFAESRNIPALKLADRVGIEKVIDVAKRFGITSPIPPYLPVAIGAADITLAEQVGAYSVFPNDGIRLTPHAIRSVATRDSIPVMQTQTEISPAIGEQTARTMMTFLREVTRAGTGAAAAQLKHPVGGKTGTTNDYTDAWFIGFSPSVTCGVWVGFDDPAETLGKKETGAQAALPIWMDFMRAAIADKPDEQFAMDKESKPTEAGAVQTAAEAKPVAATTDAKKSAANRKPADTAQKSVATDVAKPAVAKPAGGDGGAIGGNGAPASHPVQSAPSAPPRSASEPHP